jgi:hypothetical protein
MREEISTIRCESEVVNWNVTEKGKGEICMACQGQKTQSDSSFHPSQLIEQTVLARFFKVIGF